MAEKGEGGSIPDELRCRRSDGRKWRCKLRVAEGKSYCEAHLQQGKLRRRKQPVPDGLKLERSNKRIKKQSSNMNELLKIKEEIEDGDDNKVVLDLVHGQLEINGGKNPLKNAEDGFLFRIGTSSLVYRRQIRSKNVEPVPDVTVKINGFSDVHLLIRCKIFMSPKFTRWQMGWWMLPNIKANIKATAEKNIKKRQLSQYSRYSLLSKCSTCKTRYFCNESKMIKIKSRESVPCAKGIALASPAKEENQKISKQRFDSKPLKKDLVILSNFENEVHHVCDPEMVVNNHESKLEASHQLHIIRELLPVIEKHNKEKIIELDIEAKIKGISREELQVPIAVYSRKKECSFCRACIADVHRSCGVCPYILCTLCCEEFRDGYLHSDLENLKNTMRVRTRTMPSNKSWRFFPNGDIRCPPKSLGGCGKDFLHLKSLYPFGYTKDLESSAKEIVHKYKFKKPFKVDSLSSFQCGTYDEVGSAIAGKLIKNKSCFPITKESLGKNLKDNLKHWGKGQPLVIAEVLKDHQNLNWNFGYIICEYLKKSAESQKLKTTRDWCEVQFSGNQIFSGGKTNENAWDEFLKVKLWFTSSFFQDHFPDHYNAIMQSLPVQEYVNPFTGYLNLSANPPCNGSQNQELTSYVKISYGGLRDLTDEDFLYKLRCHEYDVMNILAHASKHSISQSKLNDIKILVHGYKMKVSSSKKRRNWNRLEELFPMSSPLEETNNGEEVLISDDSSSEESDDEYLNQDVNTSGAEWDIFRREDGPKLVDYLRKYSHILSRSYGSPEKVVHPLFDEIFFLDDFHKARLKEEFDVEAWSFNQDVGEAIVIPAGCPYQMRKIKSCVNVVFKFLSPESASESIKVSDELRLLPVNHKEKGNTLQVKKMVINKMHAAIEEIRSKWLHRLED
ncbi:JmjC domain-containing protein [Artemisia annua]|uniref:JmjC domain-containing protein n=1 Tax=Artemisia annua TaxID=35608 RepID=A0A2U1NEY1_ARTAN|nr:JmjC domain-containing protein [Artemisia annua]